MDWLMDIINWLLSLIGIGPVVWKPVTIGSHCYMPLFVPGMNGGIKMSWDYLSYSSDEKKHFRNHIKADAASGETPAICFCLTPRNVNGGLLENNMLAVGDDALSVLESRCQELVKAGIAVFPCLYVDDSVPRWWEIEKHIGIWIRISNQIKKYITGVILSIESNEMANNVGQLEGCINVMRNVFPEMEYYGTHLQFRSGGKYSWTGGNSTPKNANIILAEYSWNPHNGDTVGLDKFKNEYYAIQRANPTLNWISHEYNVNSESTVAKMQRQFLRDQNAWGIG